MRLGRTTAALGALVVAAAPGCASSGSPGAADATTAPPAATSSVATSPGATSPGDSGTTVVPTSRPPVTAPPATAFAPVAPQASAPAAAAALVYEWAHGDRARAATVATPAAVAALFAVRSTGLQFRGCSSGAPPVTCTYADRSSVGGGLYEVNAASTAAGGWFVASVQIEQ